MIKPDHLGGGTKLDAWAEQTCSHVIPSHAVFFGAAGQVPGHSECEDPIKVYTVGTSPCQTGQCQIRVGACQVDALPTTSSPGCFD